MWKKFVDWIKKYFPHKKIHIDDVDHRHIRDKKDNFILDEAVHPTSAHNFETGVQSPLKDYMIPKYGGQAVAVSVGAGVTAANIIPPAGETWLVYQITAEHTDVANREAVGALGYTTIDGAGANIELAGAGEVTLVNDVETIVYPTFHDTGAGHDHLLGNEPLWLRHNFMIYTFTVTGLLVGETLLLTYIYRRVLVE